VPKDFRPGQEVMGCALLSAEFVIKRRRRKGGAPRGIQRIMFAGSGMKVWLPVPIGSSLALIAFPGVATLALRQRPATVAVPQ
jgi:hypothetical protein